MKRKEKMMKKKESRWTPERIERIRKRAYYMEHNALGAVGDVFISRRKGADAVGFWQMTSRRLGFVIARGSVCPPGNDMWPVRRWNAKYITNGVLTKDLWFNLPTMADSFLAGANGRKGMWLGI